MKIKHILTLIAGALITFTSCVEEDPVFGGEDAFVANPSIISVGKDGGSQTVEINTTVAWSVETNADWITVDPKSGVNAAKITVTVAKNETEDARQTGVEIKSMGNKAVITVKQAAGGIEYGTEAHPYPASKAYAFAAALDADAKSDPVYIEGIIAKIDEQFGTQYGNATFYITDDGNTSDKMFEVYRALYIGNKKYDNTDDPNINVGDKVVIYGKCTNYKGNTPETVQNEAYVVSIEAGTTPSLTCAKPELTVAAAATSAKFSILANNLTEDWTVTTEATWITSYTKSGKESGDIEIAFEANTVEEERTATFTVKSAGVADVTLTLKQEAYSPIVDATIAEVLAKEDGSTPYRVRGVVSGIVMDSSDPTKYNAYGNFYLTDETGTIYVYGLLPEAGGATKQDVLTTKGVKEGDVMTVVGPKTSYNSNPQMKNVYYEDHKPVTAATAAEFNALADGEALYVIKGTIMNIVMDKNDNTKYNKYGNFDVVDETGKVYVYGIVPMISGKSGQDLLTVLGVKEGDIVTVVGPKTSYNEAPQMKNGYLVGVEAGTPVETPPALFLNEFDCQNKKIEIYNSTDAEVDMTGWIILKNDGEEGDKDTFVIPAALAKVPAKGFAVFTCKQSDAANGPLFGLSGTKGFKIALKKGEAVVDVVDNLTTITEIPDGKSWGRETDGAETFVLFDTPTIGESNGAAPVPPAPTTIAEVIAAIPASATGSSSAVEFEVDIAEPATVSYVNGKNAYLEDATGAILLYMENHGLQAGYTVKGKFTVKAYRYGGIPEIVAISGGQPSVGAGTAITPKDITLADLLANYDANLLRIVKISGVKVTKAFENKNAEISQGENTIVVRDQKGGLTLTANDEGDIIGIVGCYNTTKQLFFWQDDWFTSTATEVPPSITASDITGVPAAGVTDATATVTLANAEGWTPSVTPDGTVVTAASIDGTTIKYTVAENTATEARDGKITITLKKDGKDDVTKDIKVSQLAAEAPTPEGVTKVTWVRTGGADNITDGYELSFPKSNYPEPKDNEYYQDKGTADSQVNAFILQTKDRAVPVFTTTPESVKFTVNLRGGSAKDPMTYPLYACLVDAEGNNIESTEVVVVTALTTVFTDYEVTVPVTGVQQAYGLKLYHMKENGWNVRYHAITWTIVEGEAPAQDTGSGIPDYDPITGFTW